MKEFLRKGLVALFLLSLVPSASAQWGDANDVPTLLNGDLFRRFNRASSLRLQYDTRTVAADAIEFTLDLRLFVTDRWTQEYNGEVITVGPNGLDGIAGKITNLIPTTAGWDPTNAAEVDDYSDDLVGVLQSVKAYKVNRRAGFLQLLDDENLDNLQVRKISGLTINMTGNGLEVNVVGDSSFGYFDNCTPSHQLAGPGQVRILDAITPAGATPQAIRINFTSATAYTVTGSVSGVLGNGTTNGNLAYGNPFVHAQVQFRTYTHNEAPDATSVLVFYSGHPAKSNSYSLVEVGTGAMLRESFGIPATTTGAMSGRSTVFGFINVVLILNNLNFGLVLNVDHAPAPSS